VRLESGDREDGAVQELSKFHNACSGRIQMSALAIRRFDFVTIYSRDLEASKKFYVGLLEFQVLREVRNEFFQIDVAGVPICVST